MAALARGGTSTGVGVLLPRVRKIRAGRLKGQVSPRVATTKGKHWVVRVRTHTHTYTYTQILPEIQFKETFIELGIV